MSSTETILRENAKKCNLDYISYTKLLYSKELTESEVNHILDNYRYFGDYGSDLGDGPAQDEEVQDNDECVEGAKPQESPQNVVADNVCDICNKTFCSKNYLNCHKETVHLKIKKFVCDYKDCDKRFSRKNALVTHKVNLHNEKTKCNEKFCDKGFLKIKLQAKKKPRGRPRLLPVSLDSTFKTVCD